MKHPDMAEQQQVSNIPVLGLVVRCDRNAKEYGVSGSERSAGNESLPAWKQQYISFHISFSQRMYVVPSAANHPDM
jgi:hypothetical protein